MVIRKHRKTAVPISDYRATTADYLLGVRLVRLPTAGNLSSSITNMNGLKSLKHLDIYISKSPLSHKSFVETSGSQIELLNFETYYWICAPTLKMFGFSDSPPPSSPPDPSKLTLRPEECQTLTLSDTRKLGFATYGSTSTSHPVVFLFHGLPGCRIVGRSFDKVCKKIGARLITIDRPGCGLSTLADRGLTEWPKDVVSLADHLGIERFSVFGASGGGPYALACARYIPKERLRSTTVACGIGPIEALLDTTPYLSWRLGGFTPWSLKIAARYLVLPALVRPYLTKDPSRLKRVLEDQAKTPEEKEQFSKDTDGGTNLDDVVASLLETFKQGLGGVMQDGAVLARDWGFDLSDVDAEKIWLIHGDQDAQAPAKVAQWIDERLGGGKLRLLEGKTHFTIWKEHTEEMFRQSAEA
jgi:pimeloyl-ACP methyl ester carboxylesterase